MMARSLEGGKYVVFFKNGEWSLGNGIFNFPIPERAGHREKTDCLRHCFPGDSALAHEFVGMKEGGVSCRKKQHRKQLPLP